MYQYSRAIFMTVRDLIISDRAGGDIDEARRSVLHLCEATLERLASDPRYFARPARSLFEDVRPYFHIRDQAHVWCAVEQAIGLALTQIEREQEERADEFEICGATTRKGKRCRRAPLPGTRYCPSHRHLDSQQDMAPRFLVA